MTKDVANKSEATRLALTTILQRKARKNITPENQYLLDELEALPSKQANIENSARELGSKSDATNTGKVRG